MVATINDEPVISYGRESRGPSSTHQSSPSPGLPHSPSPTTTGNPARERPHLDTCLFADYIQLTPGIQVRGTVYAWRFYYDPRNYHADAVLALRIYRPVNAEPTRFQILSQELIRPRQAHEQTYLAKERVRVRPGDVFGWTSMNGRAMIPYDTFREGAGGGNGGASNAGGGGSGGSSLSSSEISPPWMTTMTPAAAVAENHHRCTTTHPPRDIELGHWDKDDVVSVRVEPRLYEHRVLQWRGYREYSIRVYVKEDPPDVDVDVDADANLDVDVDGRNTLLRGAADMDEDFDAFE